MIIKSLILVTQCLFHLLQSGDRTPKLCSLHIFLRNRKYDLPLQPFCITRKPSSARIFQFFPHVTLLPFFPSHCPKRRCRWLWVPEWQMGFLKWRSWESGDTQESCQKPLSFPWSSNALTTNQERKPSMVFSPWSRKVF